MYFHTILDVVVVYPPRNYTLHLNSDYNVTFTCTTKSGSPIWAVKVSVTNQLYTEDQKSGSNAIANGWMVEDVARNESIITITRKTRITHGDLNISCLAISTKYLFPPVSNSSYYIFSYGKNFNLV